MPRSKKKNIRDKDINIVASEFEKCKLDEELRHHHDRLSDARATKSDDAEVKVSKWNNHLVDKLGEYRQEKITLKPEIKQATNTLRNCFLQSHQRKYTQSFFAWLHNQPNFLPLGIELREVIRRTPVINPVEQDSETYDWSELGRPIYVKWWKMQQKMYRKDLAAAKDVLYRIADSEWWKWSKGSCPAYLK